MHTNAIYCGDCQRVLGNTNEFPDVSVDLIYVDPPFFSDRHYEVLWGDGYERRAFEDRWKGGIENYLAWMEPKLRECHRILKPTGTFWLHCDWHAAHYLKVLLDHIFGGNRFRNEVIWNHQILGAAHGRAFPKAHENLLRYTKGDEFTFNEDDPSVRAPYSDYIQKDLKKDEQGRWYYTRRRMTRKIRLGEEEHGLRTYVEDPSHGKLVGDVWSDLKGYQPKEKLGYPTQKPESLLERIVRVSSNENDVVLDPMCGCGTAIAVAYRTKRRWVGIDVSPTACKLMAKRMHTLGAPVTGRDVIGMPKTIEEIHAMEPFEFQNWVIQMLMGRVSAKKVGDMGIDGYLFDGTPVQVKQSENIGRNVVDNFETAIHRAKRTKGMIVAFSFGRGAHEEVARAKNAEGLEIVLKTTKELIEEE